MCHNTHGLGISSIIQIFVSYKGHFILTLEDILFIIMCMYDACALVCIWCVLMYVCVCKCVLTCTHMSHWAYGGWRTTFKGQFSSSTVGSGNWTQVGNFTEQGLYPTAPSHQPYLDLSHHPLGSCSISLTHKKDRTELKEAAPLVKFF